MRVTRDLGLLGFGDDQEHLVSVFREILSIDTDDGLDFDTDIAAVAIREELEYGGTRLRTTARPLNRLMTLGCQLVTRAKARAMADKASRA